MCQAERDGGLRCLKYAKKRFLKAFAVIDEAMDDTSKGSGTLKRIREGWSPLLGEGCHTPEDAGSVPVPETQEAMQDTVVQYARHSAGRKVVISKIRIYRMMTPSEGSASNAERVRYLDTIAWLEKCVEIADGQNAKVTAARKAVAQKKTQARDQARNDAFLTPEKVAAYNAANPSTSMLSEYPYIQKFWDADANHGLQADKCPAGSSRFQIFFQCPDYPDRHKFNLRSDAVANAARLGREIRCPHCARQQAFNRRKQQFSDLVNEYMGGDPEAWQRLSPATREMLLARAGLLDPNEDTFERGLANALIDGRITLDAFLRINDATELAGIAQENTSAIDEDAEIAVIRMSDVASNEEDVFTSATDTMSRIEQTLAAAGVVDSPLFGEDDEMRAHVIREHTESLWSLVNADPEAAETLLARINDPNATGLYATSVARDFAADLERVQAMPLPEGYNPVRVTATGAEEVYPALHQKRFALRLEEQRMMGNWSAPGAGKTLAALTASRHVGAKEIVVFVPNEVFDQWPEEITAAYPGAVVNQGLPLGLSDLPDTDGKPRYWVVKYDSISAANLGSAADRRAKKAALALLADNADMVIMDEIHRAKMTEGGTISVRRELLDKFMDDVRDNEQESYVVGMSGTPVINDLQEAKSVLRLIDGKEGRGFGIKKNRKNARAAYREMLRMGVRWKPVYTPALHRDEPVVDITEHLPAIRAEIQRARAESKNGMITPAAIERALLPYKLDAITDAVLQAKGPTIVYTEYTTGIVEPIEEHLTKQGFRVGRYTGAESPRQRRELLKAFADGDIDVIIGSRAIATGKDGLQKVSKNMVVASMPWTSAMDEQLVGRLWRQGQMEDVTVTYPITRAKISDENDGVFWSYCQDRRNRLHYKKGLSDAVLDGTSLEGTAESRSATAEHTMHALFGLAESDVIVEEEPDTDYA